MARNYYSAVEELQARQRSLIPLNIVVAVLALVAALSLLFLPLVTVHVDDFSAITEMMGGEDGTNTSPETGTEGGEGSSSEGFDAAAMLDGIEVSLSVTGMDLIRIGFAESPEETLYAMAGGTVAEISDELAARALTALASEAPADAEQLEQVRGALTELESAASDAEADAAISSIADVLMQNLSGDVNREDLETELRRMYDETKTENDGTFTTEAFLCVFISQAMNESEEGGEGGGEASVPTTFEELFAGMIGQGGEEGEGVFDNIPAFVFPVIGGVGALFAGVWVILFLFAFFHIFAKNKRFMMWYVKLFGFLPCLIFGIAPLVAGAVLPAEAMAGMGALLGMIGTMTWVSGGCYVLLWLISIFWAFPIKHKIRVLKRQL